MDAPSYATSGAPIRASVPGQVHTDLMAAGLLDDPDVGLREADQMWIGHSQWTYARHFAWDGTIAGERIELVAEGLDTFATVTLNGHEVAMTADQHIGYRWDVAHLLLPGENLLEIRFGSAWDAAHECEIQVGEAPRPYDEPYPFVRKSACNFGWDWGPHYVTAGIWRPSASRHGPACGSIRSAPMSRSTAVRPASASPWASTGRGRRRTCPSRPS